MFLKDLSSLSNIFHYNFDVYMYIVCVDSQYVLLNFKATPYYIGHLIIHKINVKAVSKWYTCNLLNTIFCLKSFITNIE